MKLLVSGSTGLLGVALIKHAIARGHICIPLKRDRIRLSLNSLAVAELDENFDSVDNFVHAAANTDVDRCETMPAECYRDNVLLTELLAAAARRRGVPMCFISSTGVYGSGQSIPWAEYNYPHPDTQHHRSKMIAEKIVLGADWSNLVVRTGWLFGGNAQAKKNFVAKRIIEARVAKNGVILSNQNQRGSPTSVDDLALRLLDLIELRARGIFNVVNEGTASRFEYVLEIVQRLRLAVEVRPVSAIDFKRIAPVSNNEMAINWRSDTLGLPPMQTWQDALAAYLITDDIRFLTQN